MIAEHDNIVHELTAKLADKLAPSTSDDESLDMERWAPVGESSDDTWMDEQNRFRELEKEQERLNNSLLSLSTHFAQVQFRLKQISKADTAERDKLLKDLEDFAFRGCTDLEWSEKAHSRSVNESEKCDISKQKERQKELITRLKEQLQDLEKYAYETGEGDLPSAEIMARQKAVIDKLHEKVQLNLELDRMSQSDLQKTVDEALKKLMNPIKAKEKLVEQLQTQIIDLERFVSFLQTEINERPPSSIASLPVTTAKKNSLTNFIKFSQKFERNQLKLTPQGSHYGDERAQLELAVDSAIQVMEKYFLLSLNTETSHFSPYSESSDEVFDRSEEEIVAVIRKRLCSAMRGLFEHGMNDSIKNNNFTQFGCYPKRLQVARSSSVRRLEHVWDVVMYYYDLKFGREYCDAPIRRLSQSYQLDAVAGRSITSKQLLLSTIENIASTHNRLKRSSDAMWKALVSAALNEKKLSAWTRIIFRTRQIVEHCYASWSYVARTGCEDTCQLLERLQKYNYHLPVDLAVRPFHQMKHAF
ncbi:unnamed protein product [Thelazia callipaeda]|uniref:RUN domain-containing protein n=1 Tax=Thelazia callipaeda TaxID=103827 RepID=A0A158RBC8_THECL|nr:unnamed protein product [Thelazia callipaeda]